MKTIMTVLSLLAVLSGCSSNSISLQTQNENIRSYIASNNLQHVSRVNSFRFQGWNSLTDEFMFLSSSPKRNYLIELKGFCDDIRWAHVLRIHRQTDATLHAKFDSVFSLRNPQMNCRIDKIYPVTKEQRKAIYQLNEQKPEEPKSAEQPDTE